MKLPEIEEMFRNRARIIGSLFLLSPQDAIELVRECRAKHIAGFGAEGFYIVGERVQPSMEHSISQDNDSKTDYYETTISFLQSHFGSDLWFEVMVDAPRQP